MLCDGQPDCLLMDKTGSAVPGSRYLARLALLLTATPHGLLPLARDWVISTLLPNPNLR